ncbi:MAG: TetR/AcrR family transcriptional regulator [Gammaproteobacteria bacterium]|nr:TetR/AcrR family transcriptional regulator [Gammaproteobacteria bacterium]
MCASADLFLSNGFQGTSMDSVAQRAGVSKQTVYSHFSNKEELFKACIRSRITRYGLEEAGIETAGNLQVELPAFCRRFIDLLFDPEVVAMHRVVLAEAGSPPRIAALFFENGPKRAKLAVADYLRDHAAAGRLKIEEERIFYAAVQLFSAVVGMYQLELLLGLRSSVPEEELERHLRRVVEDFLTLYGVQQDPWEPVRE